MTNNPLESKTITLTCGKLTTGVSVKPWTGIFMLRNSSSPETYFQAAFRVQTPGVIKNPDSKSPNKEEILKEEKKELTKEEKEYKSRRKKILEKLIKFATRIPVFMYLTDYRERSLKDIITQLEPGLFKKVTGLTVKDFDLLVSLGVFNEALMNDAVYKFKRYEDASLEYTGINKHEGEDVGLYSTVLSREDYKQTFVNEDVIEYNKDMKYDNEN